MSSIKFEFSWKTLPWDQFREKLCLIQTQIFNLIKYKNFKKALVKNAFPLSLNPRNNEVFEHCGKILIMTDR